MQFARSLKCLPPECAFTNWPTAQRKRNLAGRPGKLHAECAIVDDAALISSANLTDDAFNRNMELGVSVRDPSMVTAVVDHFASLIDRGVLREVVAGHSDKPERPDGLDFI